MQNVRTKKLVFALLSFINLIQPCTTNTGNSCSAPIDEQDRPVNTPTADDQRLYARSSPYAAPCNVQQVEIFHAGRRTTVNIPLAPGQKPSARPLSGEVVRSSDVRPRMTGMHRTGYGNRIVYINVRT